MKNLKAMSVNPFKGLNKFGRQRVQIFIYLHLMYMKSQVAAHAYLAANIAATQTLYNALFGIVIIKDQKIELRKSQRKTVVQVLKEAKEAAHRIESRIIDKLTKSNAIYVEMFSNGIGDFNHLNMHNAYILISRLKAGCATYETEIGADMKTLIDGVYTDFDNARQAQTITAGTVTGNNPDYDKSLDLMEDQLYVNFLDVQKENKTDPSQTWGFFEQEVLTRPAHHAGSNDNEPITESVFPNSQIEAGISYAEDSVFTLKNRGLKSLFVMGAVTPDEPIHPNSLEILPGATLIITGAQLGSPNNRFFIIANKDAIELGVIEIKIV